MFNISLIFFPEIKTKSIVVSNGGEIVYFAYVIRSNGT